MSNAAEQEVPAGRAERLPGRRIDPGKSWAVFRWLVVAATAWFLLRELAPLLRPLLLAIFLAYVILPVHLYVKGQGRGGVGYLVLLAAVGLVVVIIGVRAHADAVEFIDEIPHLHERTHEVRAAASRYAEEHLPWLADAFAGTASFEDQGAAHLRETLGGLVNATAGLLVEALQVVFYLILILLEAGRFPRRVRDAFQNEQAEHLLALMGDINAAMASYLKVKVKTSLALALPAMLILWLFGIKFVLLWGTLTFLANFIPYLGTVVTCSLPILYGLLDRGIGWQTVAVAVLLVSTHVSSGYLVEPAMTGKAVNLSPLIVLIALSFWGLCWGLIGLVLAVPLTTMLKIVLESAPSTRPIAWLMESKG